MTKFKGALSDIMTNPVTRFATIGTMFRFFSMFACDYFMPAFFLKNYPMFNNEFGLAIAVIVLFGGMTSSLLGGIMADKYSEKHPRAYANICTLGSLLAWPFMIASVLITQNFWLSIGLTAARYFIGENFWSPSITMIQKSSPQNKKGEIYSAYQFYTILSGCLSTLLFGTFMNIFDAASNPVMIGKLLAGFGTVGYLGSAVAYFLAGKHFRRMKEEKGEVEPVDYSENKGGLKGVGRWFDKRLENLIFGDIKIGTII